MLDIATAAERRDQMVPLAYFEQLVRHMPSPYMVLDRDLVYVEANDAYCRSTEGTREDILGRYVFERFPPTGEGGRQIEESLRRVLATGVTESLPFVAYPIPLPASAGGGMGAKYWSCVHFPLLDARGEVAYVVQNAVDVTELHQLKTLAFGPGAATLHPGESTIFNRTREIEALNRSLAEETQGLRDLFMQAPGFMAVLTGPELVFALANSAYQQLIGNRQIIGKPIAQALPEAMGQGFADLLLSVMRQNRPFVGRAMSVRIQRSPGGPPEERFLDFIYQPVVGADGLANAVFVEGSDVTDRVLAERQQKLLLDELNHRVKNTLATVQAIADQTLRNTGDPAAFREAFESRLMALSATHDLLTAANWRSASLREVAHIEFRPYGAERYRLSGPDVALPPAQAVALGLLFHELATNAAKYGALGAADGLVEVVWTLADGAGADSAGGPLLTVNWREHDGPPVLPPTRRGFGSRLIERSLAPLGGTAALDFAPDGLRCTIRLPLTPTHEG